MVHPLPGKWMELLRSTPVFRLQKATAMDSRPTDAASS